jgi:hypothetical protein
MCKCNIHNSGVVGKISFRATESKDTKKKSVKFISLKNVRSKLELKIK